LELISLLLTSFVKDKFYESADEQVARVEPLIRALKDRSFAAKAAIYARRTFGMRSITHVLAGELVPYARGTEWAKRFYDQIVYRPDDMTEILSYLATKQGGKIHPVPNAIKKGFAMAMGRFDAYSLGKYRGEGKAVSMVDVVNLIHPKATSRNAEALKALVAGELRQTDTWENKLTQAGQVAETEDEKVVAKAQVWSDLLREGKLGYFALLRNLRNILQQAPEMVELACASLTDDEAIRKSLVLPFRYQTAMDEIEKLALPDVRKVLITLEQALDIAISNVPVFEGRTLIALDVSGSMWGTSMWNLRNGVYETDGKQPIDIGALFAAILYKANEHSDLIVFDSKITSANMNPNNTALLMAKQLRKTGGGGTDFRPIFRAVQPYDRIIILSDMQAWMHDQNPLSKDLADYRKRVGKQTKIYSFDLQGYGSLQFPEPDVFAIAGFSEKVFDMMKLLEQDRQALVNTIAAVEL
jgi:hypothetical protein